MPPKKLNPILGKILQNLEVAEKDDLDELKKELTEKQKRLGKTIKVLNKGVTLLRAKKKGDEGKDFFGYLKETDPLKKYLAKKLKEIMRETVNIR